MNIKKQYCKVHAQKFEIFTYSPSTRLFTTRHKFPAAYVVAHLF